MWILGCGGTTPSAQQLAASELARVMFTVA